jgi:hypothetical protein
VLCQADAASLPLPDESIGIVLGNGIFNLNPARPSIFGELRGVVKGGGAVYSAELILKYRLPPEQQVCQSNWFA